MFPPETKILIADDVAGMRSLIREALQELGITRIIEAQNGKEALDQLQISQDGGDLIQCIFLDINMPEMSGMEVLQNLKQNPKYLEIPIILVTSDSEVQQVINAMTAGALDYIVKPFERHTLKSKLESVWKRKPHKGEPFHKGK